MENKKSNKKDYYSRLQSLNSKDVPGDDYFMKSSDGSNKYEFFSGNKFFEVAESKISFSDIIQDKELKEQMNYLIDEYKFQNKIKNFGLKCDNKIIFHGPSGCGKTLTALALANALKKKIYIINLATVVSSSFGKTSNNIFEVVEEAKLNKAIIFFDEFDALSKMRKDDNDHGEMKRITSALLQMMDLLDDETILIAATNYVDLIDPAIFRRFSKRIMFNFPSKRYLKMYIEKLIKSTNFKVNEGVVSLLVDELEGLSYAETRDKFNHLLKRYIVRNLKQGKSNINKIDKTIV